MRNVTCTQEGRETVLLVGSLEVRVGDKVEMDYDEDGTREIAVLDYDGDREAWTVIFTNGEWGYAEGIC